MFIMVRKSLWTAVGFPARDQKVKITLEMVRVPVGKDNEGKQILQMVALRPAKMIITNIKKVLGIGRVVSIKISGMARPRMFAIRGEALIPQTIWIGGKLGDYGTDSAVGISRKSRWGLRL